MNNLQEFHNFGKISYNNMINVTRTKTIFLITSSGSLKFKNGNLKHKTINK